MNILLITVAIIAAYIAFRLGIRTERARIKRIIATDAAIIEAFLNEIEADLRAKVAGDVAFKGDFRPRAANDIGTIAVPGAEG